MYAINIPPQACTSPSSSSYPSPCVTNLTLIVAHQFAESLMKGIIVTEVISPKVTFKSLSFAPTLTGCSEPGSPSSSSSSTVDVCDFPSREIIEFRFRWLSGLLTRCRASKHTRFHPHTANDAAGSLARGGIWLHAFMEFCNTPTRTQQPGAPPDSRGVVRRLGRHAKLPTEDNATQHFAIDAYHKTHRSQLRLDTKHPFHPRCHHHHHPADIIFHPPTKGHSEGRHNHEGLF